MDVAGHLPVFGFAAQVLGGVLVSAEQHPVGGSLRCLQGVGVAFPRMHQTTQVSVLLCPTQDSTVGNTIRIQFGI